MTFEQEVIERIVANESNEALQESAQTFMVHSLAAKYSYNFAWFGRPIIQYPQDIVAVQELVWNVRPDLIIETGIAHGGSLILSASLLALLDACDAASGSAGTSVHTSKRRVLGIDIEIRSANRSAIEAHPLEIGRAHV